MAEEKKEIKEESKKESKEEKAEVPAFKFREPTDHDYEVLKYMVVTEKSQKLAAEKNVITIRVSKDAKKPEIKDAIQAIFGVKVEKVNTVNVPEKKRSYRRGFAQAFKKAYITIDKAYDLGKISNAVASEDRK